MLLRDARPEDTKPVTDLVFRALKAYGVEPDPAGLDAEVLEFGHHRDGAGEWVVEINGKVAGMCRLARQTDAVGWVSKLFVDSRYRRRGAGRLLLRSAVRAARDRGHVRVGLQTRSLFVEAIKLYESEGWERGPDLPQGYGPDRTYWKAL
jgi:putative acetyltransferase